MNTSPEPLAADRTVSAQTALAALPERVFELLLDTTQVASWNVLHTGYRSQLPARLSIGLEFTEQISLMGIPADIDWTVQEVQAPAGDGPGRISISGDGPLDLQLTMRYAVSHGTEPDSCQLSLAADLNGDPVRGPMGASVAGSVEEALTASLAQLAANLAHGAAAHDVDPLAQPVLHAASGRTLDPLTPVIVGVGQIVHREPLEPAQHPAQLSAQAVEAALTDAGDTGALRSIIDGVYAVASASWTYRDQARAVASELGIEPESTVVSARFGGDAGQNLINEAAASVGRGELRVAVITGAEIGNSLAAAQRRGVSLDWPAQQAEVTPDRVIGSDASGNNAAESEVGLGVPIYMYSLMESALAGQAGRTPAEQAVVASELWAALSGVAATNPAAWQPQAYDAVTLRHPTPENRAVAGIYTKLMCANLTVDMASAVIVTTVAQASAAGISQDRWVFLQAGAAGYEEWFVSHREDLADSPTIRALGEVALRHCGLAIDDVDLVDLYSCFPAAVQIGAKALGLPVGDPERPLSVTGGLTFAGGPGNNFGGHSVATMVQKLRDQPGAYGLTTSLGWYLTKHALAIYSTTPPLRPYEALQPVLAPPAVRPVLTAYQGEAVVEACTVPYGRDGSAEAVIVSLVTPSGARVLVRSDHAEVISLAEGENLTGRIVEVIRAGAGGDLKVGTHSMPVPAAPEPSVLVEDRGPVRIITLNRPQRRNAIDLATAERLERVIDAFEDDDSVRVAILTGAGGTFCAGMDLKAAAAGQFAMTAKRGALGIAALPIKKPVIAAVEGHALAGGCELALVADLIVASTQSEFGIPEPKRGLVAAAGGVLRLAQRLPRNVAMELALTGNPMPAVRMAELGLVNRLAEPGAVLTAALDLAAEIVANAPISVAASKQIIVESPDWSAAEEMDRQTDLASRAIFSEDATEGVVAFTEKRPPVWKGR